MLYEPFRARHGRLPGHMGVTTLGREWDTNPFLAELRAAAMSPVPVQTGAREQR